MTQEHDPLDLAGQQRAASESDDEKRARRELEANDFLWLMQAKQGRRIMWRLLEKAGVFRSSYTGDNDTFFREGMRNMGLMLLADVTELCPELYHTMVKEQREYAARQNAKRSTKR